MSVQALIFDFDGLILDTETSLVTAWQEIYAEFGLEMPLTRWASMLGTSSDPIEAYEVLEAELGHPVDRSGLKKRKIARELVLLEQQTCMPGIRELIEESKVQGKLLAVASSSEHDWVDVHLRNLGLFAHFDVIVCADDVDATKPSPDLYNLALDRLGVDATDALALEDSPHGVSAAIAAGLFCIAVPNDVTRTGSFEHADLLLTSLGGVGLREIERHFLKA